MTMKKTPAGKGATYVHPLTRQKQVTQAVRKYARRNNLSAAGVRAVSVWFRAALKEARL
jgi:hypothetical protein